MQKKALRERVSCPGAGLYIWYHLEYLHKEANRGHPNQMAEAPFSEKIFFTLSELLTLSLKCNTDWPRYRAMLHLMPVAHTDRQKRESGYSGLNFANLRSERDTISTF